MRKRDVRVGMDVVHAKSGKHVGIVLLVDGVLVHTDSDETPIAHWSELSPAPAER